MPNICLDNRSFNRLGSIPAIYWFLLHKLDQDMSSCKSSCCLLASTIILFCNARWRSVKCFTWTCSLGTKCMPLGNIIAQSALLILVLIGYTLSHFCHLSSMERCHILPTSCLMQLRTNANELHPFDRSTHRKKLIWLERNELWLFLRMTNGPVDLTLEAFRLK